MERALIGGVTSHLVLAGPARGVRTGALLVEASRDHPDGRAAAALIEALARMMPDVPIDHKPLMKEAQALYVSLGFQPIAAYRFNPVPGSSFLELSL